MNRSSQGEIFNMLNNDIPKTKLMHLSVMDMASTLLHSPMAAGHSESRVS